MSTVAERFSEKNKGRQFPADPKKRSRFKFYCHGRILYLNGYGNRLSDACIAPAVSCRYFGSFAVHRCPNDIILIKLHGINAFFGHTFKCACSRHNGNDCFVSRFLCSNFNLSEVAVFIAI